ncbi:MAG: hypothetical protein APF82_03650 [Sphingomonadales bacterium BRH_c42]|nr:MAG: hypothetical protein APF82_03650 [Sphingomonadales bacterium BRH_c42]
MKANRIWAAAILGATLALQACGGGADEAAPTDVEGVPGLSVSNGRMVLAPVAGNPAAVYFDLAYEGDRGLTIRRADVAGAKSAMLHDYGEYEFKVQMMEALPIGIKKGDKLSFEPGKRHVMAFDISPDLKPGGTTEVTLTVSGGDKYTFPVTIKAAGDER